MHKYRTHTCSEITKKNSGNAVKLSGWIHRKRDHGNLLFFDNSYLSDILFNIENRKARVLEIEIMKQTKMTNLATLGTTIRGE